MRFRGMLELILRVRILSFFYFVALSLAGQAPVLFQMPEPIDEATPKEAHNRTGFDRNEYELVFSDEFEVEGRTF
jgi:beta-glucan synthesis-associated protein KRE6